MQQIHAAAAQGGQQRRRGRGRLGSVGFSADIALKVHHRQVRVRQNRRHILEHRAEIVVGHGHTGIDHVVRHVQVASRLDMDGGNGASLGGGSLLGFLRRGNGLHLSRSFRAFRAGILGHPVDCHAAGHQDHRRQQQRHAHPARLRLTAFALGFPFLPAFFHSIALLRHVVPSLRRKIATLLCHYTLFFSIKQGSEYERCFNPVSGKTPASPEHFGEFPISGTANPEISVPGGENGRIPG